MPRFFMHETFRTKTSAWNHSATVAAISYGLSREPDLLAPWGARMQMRSRRHWCLFDRLLSMLGWWVRRSPRADRILVAAMLLLCHRGSGGMRKIAGSFALQQDRSENIGRPSASSYVTSGGMISLIVTDHLQSWIPCSVNIWLLNISIIKKIDITFLRLSTLMSEHM